jgi:phage terminase small subunit
MALTNKEKAFCKRYIRDFNATQTAIDVGYSERSARQIGSLLLTKDDIKAEIAHLVEEKIMKPDEINTRLAEIARGDIANLMDIHPAGFTFRLLETDEDGNRITNPNTKLIRKIKQKVTTTIGKKEDSDDREIIETEIELYPADSALQFLAKLSGLVTDKVDVTTKGEKVTADDDRYDRALSTLADAIREIIPGESTGSDSALDTPK